MLVLRGFGFVFDAKGILYAGTAKLRSPKAVHRIS